MMNPNKKKVETPIQNNLFTRNLDREEDMSSMPSMI